MRGHFEPLADDIDLTSLAMGGFRVVRLDSVKVLPQIDDLGIDDAKSVKKEFEKLSAGPLKGLRLAMMHGQMKTDEKQNIHKKLNIRERKQRFSLN